MSTMTTNRYQVRYTTPTGARGILTLTAETADDAAAKAREVHAKGRYFMTPKLGFAGPGGGVSGAWRAPHLLPKKDRDGMVYDTPVLLEGGPAEAERAAHEAAVRVAARITDPETAASVAMKQYDRRHFGRAA